MATEPKAKKTRRHSPRQLEHRPVTVTADGPITVSTELRGKQVVVVIGHPAGATIEQPAAETVDLPPPPGVH